MHGRLWGNFKKEDENLLKSIFHSMQYDKQWDSHPKQIHVRVPKPNNNQIKEFNL
jgi:hypothetical protein